MENGVAEQIQEYTDIPYNVSFDDIIVSQSLVSDITEFILGIVLIFLVVGLTLVTSMDIMYINFPVIQDTARKRNWDGSLSIRRVKPISNDARLSVEMAITNKGSANTIYLKRRLKTYFVFALIIGVILTGSNAIAGIISKILTEIVYSI